MSATKINRQIERHNRIRGILSTMVAAENTRCACGYHGSWDHTIRGTSGPASTPCVWAGCPNCSGSAIGAPLTATDWRWIGAQDESIIARLREEEVVMVVAKRYDIGSTVGGAPYTLGEPQQRHDGRYRVPVIGPRGEDAHLMVDPETEDVRLVCHV